MSEVQAGDPHEPSYYEIALTNRQVLVAFVILLVCVVGAFFAGVWVGRGGAPRQAGTAAASQVAQVNPTGQPLQELQFFSGKPGQSAPPTSPEPQPAASKLSPPAPPPISTSPNQSLAADLSAKPEVTTAAPAGNSQVLSPVPQPPPGSDVEPSASPAPAPHAAPPVAVPAGGAKPKVPPVVTETSPAPAPTTPATTTATGEMVVQVFSSADGEQAKKTLTRVNKGGYKAYLSPLLVGKQTMYRVRIGPFTDRAQAQKIADQVRKKFRLDTWITR
ncbi:MAG: SPOR domain-containing protein [Acidobacteriota bacterium]